MLKQMVLAASVLMAATTVAHAELNVRTMTLYEKAFNTCGTHTQIAKFVGKPTQVPPLTTWLQKVYELGASEHQQRMLKTYWQRGKLNFSYDRSDWQNFNHSQRQDAYELYTLGKNICTKHFDNLQGN